ncbi:MAG: cytochrome c family protein [Rhodospirillales bacterium]
MHFSVIEKVGASVLIVAWLIYGANFLGNTLVYVQQHASSMEVAGKAAGGGETAAEAPAAPVDIRPLIAAADPAAGEKVFGKCKACHTIAQGGPAGVGPNLWNVVGGPHAHMDGFAYSAGMTGMHDKKWSYEELDAFLASPKTAIPGTKMTFAGLKKPEERAAVIAYLRSQASSPIPLP